MFMHVTAANRENPAGKKKSPSKHSGLIMTVRIVK